jgi:hypothetical protein
MHWTALALLASVVIACGSPPTPRTAKKSTANTVVRARADDVEEEAIVPARCPDRKRTRCLPPEDWVQKLCDDVYPDVALHMFGPETPWHRFYMVANAEPFNASGGMSLMGEKLRRGEEVIALRRRRAKDGIAVSDTSGYDVLRWNGACASIHDGDYTLRRPDNVLHSRIEWRDLGLPVRKALEQQPRIRESNEGRRKHCRGVGFRRVTEECEDYDRRLIDEIVEYVRNGGELAEPAKAP